MNTQDANQYPRLTRWDGWKEGLSLVEGAVGVGEGEGARVDEVVAKVRDEATMTRRWAIVRERVARLEDRHVHAIMVFLSRESLETERDSKDQVPSFLSTALSLGSLSKVS